MDLGEIEWGLCGLEWTGLAQDMDKRRALVNPVMNLRVPYNTVKLSSGYTTDGLSNSAELISVS
jgi:hypothetical protein